ncbi:MAG TPA: aminotransferase class V-fold PLP-dependent enzyme [Casimicrobiaceae bacterium]|nr:aminotransferase class V-fold PLP-dependent enzyme [Casimicrobiaceae bacterium]
MGDGSSIEARVSALGGGAFTEAALATHVAPLFSRSLRASPERIYLGNHSLGRPLDAMDDDVREGLAAWYDRMGGAWDAWMAEMKAYRSRLARLMGAPASTCIVPKTSAGQGLRAVLNTHDSRARVVATRGEFDSLDVILREYARRARIELASVEPRTDCRFATEDILHAIDERTDLVVVSDVIFNTGQRIDRIDAIVERAHRVGAHVLLDVYHSLGVIPIDVAALDVDFAVGGSYKYLRGGPGACFLYLHPRHLDGSLRTLDIGWFAKREPFAYERPDPPELAAGGDAFLESTPAVLAWYQARAGQRLALALDVSRVRAYSLSQQRRLVSLLADEGIAATGGTDDHGAFVVVTHERAAAWREALAERGIVTDARGNRLRLCPDVLTTGDELVRAASALGAIAH